MLPYYTYRKNPLLSLKLERNFSIFLKEIILYFLLYFYPRSIAKFYNLIFKIKFFNKYKFVRSDCDHFGSWAFLLICLRKNKKKNNLFFCLAKKNSINNNLLSYFYKYNLIIIYNPILQFLLSPLFFTLKNSIDVNGHFPLSYLKNSKKYPNYPSIGPIDESFLKKICINKKNYDSKINFLGNKRGIVIFYPRLGNWIFSANKSRRNMSLKIAEILINKISNSHDLILLGDTYKYFSGFKNKIYDFDELLERGISPGHIFSLSDCIIGSISGATHFPSLIYNIPTLYLGEIPLDHLIAIYNMVPRNKKAKNRIPIKDSWFIFNYESEDLISTKLWVEIISNFLSFKKLKNNVNYETYNLESNYTLDTKKKIYNLLPSKSGNLHIHTSYK